MGTTFDFQPAPTPLIKGSWDGEGWREVDGEIEVYEKDEAMLLERHDAGSGKLTSVKVDGEYLAQWSVTDYLGVKFTGKPSYRLYRSRAELCRALDESLPVRGSGASTEVIKVDLSDGKTLRCHRYKFTWDHLLGRTISVQAVEFKL